MKINQENCPHRHKIETGLGINKYSYHCSVIEKRNVLLPKPKTLADWQKVEASECYPSVRYCRCPLNNN